MIIAFHYSEVEENLRCDYATFLESRKMARWPSNSAVAIPFLSCGPFPHTHTFCENYWLLLRLLLWSPILSSPYDTRLYVHHLGTPLPLVELALEIPDARAIPLVPLVVLPALPLVAALVPARPLPVGAGILDGLGSTVFLFGAGVANFVVFGAVEGFSTKETSVVLGQIGRVTVSF